MIKIPQPHSDYYPLEGGLDLVSPAIALSPGKIIDSQNYEPGIAGGYRRIDGYERFDGTASPTAAVYWILSTNLTGTVAVGNTVTGASSSATGIVLGIFTGYLVLGRVSGTYTVGEALTVAAVAVATVAAAQLQGGAVYPTDDADYRLLAANDRRQFIAKVPGSGPVRGVWVFNDVTYAFRDNAGGTASLMYKATAGGWVQVVFQTELRFASATGQINIGDVVTGGTSGATGTVLNALLMTGTWTTSGVGSLVLGSVTGTFSNGELLKVATVSKATSSAASAAITRLPGGRLEFDNFNFSGAGGAKKMYGCDGVNTAFEFDGTNYYPIHTGMTNDKPLHIRAHKGSLFLSFGASVQYSGIGAPYAWTIVLGAGEFNCSSNVTGFLPQGSNSSGSSLAIFTAERTFVLYGNSSADFKLQTSVFDLGYVDYTCQQVGNDAYGLTNRGVQSLITTLNYGDFDYSSVSHMVQPLINRKQGLAIASNSIRGKNQYRVYYSDGTALAIGLTGQQVSALTLLNYARPVRCIVSATLSNGSEVTYFGSDDGYVYQDNIGTSQDGVAIEAWCRLAFNNIGSPRIRKRFVRAIIEVTIDSYSAVNFSYDLGYGSYDIAPSAPTPDKSISISGVGGYWDQFVWDQFTWDAQLVNNPSISIDGTEKNIGLLFYSNRAQDGGHTLQGVTLLSIPRRLER